MLAMMTPDCRMGDSFVTCRTTAVILHAMIQIQHSHVLQRNRGCGVCQVKLAVHGWQSDGVKQGNFHNQAVHDAQVSEVESEGW